MVGWFWVVINVVKYGSRFEYARYYWYNMSLVTGFNVVNVGGGLFRG